MFDISSLPISGGVILGALAWAGVSTFALGPVVADRTIQKSGWHKICPAELAASLERQVPRAQSRPQISCNSVMGIFGSQAQQFCAQGGDALIDLMTTDPLAGQKEQLRQREIARLQDIAAKAPSRCSCAASAVAADRITWGLYAGSARMMGGPKDLSAKLNTALSSPSCKSVGGSEQ
ncbi:MAG: hypothetical protein AAFQ10_00100 [Pseudomonadota bacterium]